MKRYSGILSKNKNNLKYNNSELIFGARVKFVILDDKTNPEIFKEFGEWNSIGGILFHNLNSPSPFKDISRSNFAKPLFPNQKNFPLENEIVYIISLPSNTSEIDVNSREYYYFQPINIWNSVHHNAIPDALGNQLKPESQQQDYTQTQAGSVRRVTDGSTDIPLGETFKEKTEISNLLPFEGDVIHEGRWGQSIRFGSTVKNSNIKNIWSNSGENGDPLIIIRNGQFEKSEYPWVPILEDINKNVSDIWFTSTQQIPISLSNESYASYNKDAPIDPKQFNESQIILSSNRLILLSKKDSILLNANKTIHLSANDSLNLDSKKYITLESPKINLGKDAKEPIILGDSFLNDLKTVLKSFSELCAKLPTVGMITPYVPNTEVTLSSTKLKIKIDSLVNNIDKYKSKVSFSK